ncbi:MAG: hypothetical protein ABIJ86_06495, partial [Spirochaetota bacterium]
KGMMRLWCYIGWHNYHKRFRINNPASDLSTHAEHAGLLKQRMKKSRDVARSSQQVILRNVTGFVVCPNHYSKGGEMLSEPGLPGWAWLVMEALPVLFPRM